MTSRQRSTALGIGGLVASLAAGAAIVWGRFRDVEVPRNGEWPGAATLCAEQGVDRGALNDAIADVVDHEFSVRLLPRGSDCTPRDGLVVLRVDEALDVGFSGLGDGWDGGSISTWDKDEDGTVWGRTTVTQTEAGVILRADIALHPNQSHLSTLHEVLHALGWGHPVAPPTGHVMHPHNPGTKDWRGVRGP